ncbi:MAG: adenylyltransferase/cytidyltransferase family protein, partial [Bacteroidales bacterium]|nr:adenylyltransferase/cytidyltransferase family protein [Bacteroidales bacterium]
MKVAVYSGSFNPLHKGHEAILRHLTRDGRYGRVLLVVTPQNPFKDKADDAPQRLQAAKQAILRHSDIKADVSD